MFGFLKKKQISLKEGRKFMNKWLKEFVVPEIKQRGFSGSYPHFRRERNGRYEFVSFQFRLHGGSFVVEAAHITRADLPVGYQETPFDKLDHGHTALRRRIVGTNKIDPSWFSYETFTKESQYEELAKSVVPLLTQLDQYLA
jgi:hypothetical protein